MPPVPPVSGGVELETAVASALAPAGPLARSIPAFETREAQVRLAAAVSKAFKKGGILLAEAGTGTGKTLAYLIPAILSGHRVLVSTGTKNLQEQIYFKDLPILRDALGVPFTAAYMKGRGNYLCLHRFETWRDGGAIRTFDETQSIRMIDEWSRQIRDRRSGGARRSAGRRAVLAGDFGERRELHRRRVSALRRLFRDENAAARRRRPTSSSSTITCCAPTRRCARTPTGK